MRLQLPRRTLKDDLRVLPLRRIAGIAGLLVASAMLWWRIADLRASRTLALSTRAERIMVVKRLHDRVLSYSEQYGRPIFVWTGVRHSSAAESTLYQRLRRDLVDSSVRYWYDDKSFRVAWYYDRPSPRPEDAQIVLSNEWPESASRYAHARWVVFHPVPPRIRKPFADGRIVK